MKNKEKIRYYRRFLVDGSLTKVPPDTEVRKTIAVNVVIYHIEERVVQVIVFAGKKMRKGEGVGMRLNNLLNALIKWMRLQKLNDYLEK